MYQIAQRIFRLKSEKRVTARLSEKFGKLWIAAEVLLFVLVGAAITLMIPGALTDVIGVVLMAACVITAVTLSKRQTPKIQ